MVANTDETESYPQDLEIGKEKNNYFSSQLLKIDWENLATAQDTIGNDALDRTN